VQLPCTSGTVLAGGPYKKDESDISKYFSQKYFTSNININSSPIVIYLQK